MEGGAKGVVAIVFGLAMMTAMVVQGDANINCVDVGFLIAPCFHYLTGKATKPSFICCHDIKKLKLETSTTEDRRAVCDCFRKVGEHFASHIIPERAVELPRSCGVDLGVPIRFSNDTKCSDIP